MVPFSCHKKLPSFVAFYLFSLVIVFSRVNHQIATKKSFFMTVDFCFFLSFFLFLKTNSTIFVQLRVSVLDLTKQFKELAHFKKGEINKRLTHLPIFDYKIG